MKKFILLIVIISGIMADPNLPSQIDQSQGWFRTGWACMDIWSQDNRPITDLKAWFTNYVAQAILDAANNSAANTIIPPTFVINAADQAQSGNPWPLIDFFFQYVYSINYVINNWISSNQTYLQNISNACTEPIQSTNFDCNLLPNLTLQDLYEPIINKIFSTYGSQSGTPSSFANMTSGFGSLGKNFADGTITMKINMAGCGSWGTGTWTMGSSINTNIISVPAWTLFTDLLKTNHGQQVGTNGKSSINIMNTFGSMTNAQFIHYSAGNTLGSLKCYAGNSTVENCISSWSPATNEFALAGSWQNNPCQAVNEGEINSPIMSIGVVHGTNGFCLPKQPNWTQFQNPGFMDGCQVTVQL